MASSTRHAPGGRWYRGLLAGVAAGSVAAVTLPATAAASTGTAATPHLQVTGGSEASDTSTLTLVTGQKVTVVMHGSTPTAYEVHPGQAHDDGLFSWQASGGEHYEIPGDVLPYLGRGLDKSLFDVTALVRVGRAGTAKIPVTLTFAAGANPTAPPGVVLTSTSGTTAQGYVTEDSGAAFDHALRARIGADVAAGKAPGSTPLFGGLTSMSVAASAAPAKVAPHYPMHILQINATDMNGAPADVPGLVLDNDSVARMGSDIYLNGGVDRVAVPAGDYTVAAPFMDFDDQGNTTGFRLVTALDVTVPDSGAPTGVTLDEKTATSAVSASTPRASVPEWKGFDVERGDATGKDGWSFGIGSWDPIPVAVNPQPVPGVGTVRTQARFDQVSAVPGDAYRYDLDFASDHIDADQGYTATPSQLATVRHHFSSDPANDQNMSLLAGPFDPSSLEPTDLISGSTQMPAPGNLTEYVETYAGSLWTEDYASLSTNVHAEPRAFKPGGTYDVNWLHGPLAPTLGRNHDDSTGYCLMCTAGSTTTLGFDSIGDSTPDHTGQAVGTLSLSSSVDGQQVTSNDPDSQVIIGGVPSGAATYRVVFSTDHSADTSKSQSTHTLTDLTVKSPSAADPGSALPAGQECYGGDADTPCQILPALNLTYDLATDLTNTSHAPVQAMGLTVDHISYDGNGSRAPITSVAVKVSFDGGATWKSATVTGTAGHYAAQWANPSTASAPMLQVTATDTIGGSISQTVTNAYSYSPATAGEH